MSIDGHGSQHDIDLDEAPFKLMESSMNYVPNSEQIGGVVRALLALGGGYLIAKGYVTGDQWQTESAAFLALVVGGWSMWTNRPGTVIPPKSDTLGSTVPKP